MTEITLKFPKADPRWFRPSSKLAAMLLTLLALSFVTGVADSKPTIFWTSSPVKAGETVLSYGANLANVTSVQLNDSAKTQAQILQSTDHAAAFPLSGEGSYPVVMATITTPLGQVQTWVNKPTVWWTQDSEGREVQPGDAIEVFGTCLGTTDSATSVTIQASNRSFTIKPGPSDLYHLHLTLPNDLPPGPAQMVVTRAGVAGEPFAFQVSPSSAAISQGELTGDLGLVGDGLHDDTAALQNAIAKGVANHQAIVLPAGRFRLTSGITLPPQCDLRGTQEGRTFLIFDVEQTAPGTLLTLSPYTSLSDLTVFGTNYQNAIAGGGTDGSGHVVVRRVRVRVNPYMGHLKVDAIGAQMLKDQNVVNGDIDSMQFKGAYICVENCDVDGAGTAIVLDHVTDSVVRGNRFVVGRWGNYSVRICKRVIFQDNAIVGGDLMSIGGGINSQFGFENIYFTHNRLERFYGWDREAVTTDAPGGGYYGTVAQVSQNRLDLTDPLKGGTRWRGGGAFILGGKGQGQYRVIRDVVGQSLTLDRPWDVEPDSTSVVTVIPIITHVLMLNNTIVDAGVAIQFYGSCVDVIADGNHSVRTYGITTMGRKYTGVEPSWYVQLSNNTIDEPISFHGSGTDSATSVEGGIGCIAYDPRQTPAAPVILGNVIRDNTISSDGSIHLGWGGLRSKGIDLVEDTLVEGNTVKDSPIGIHIGPSCTQVLMVNNKLTGCKQEVVDERPKK